MQNKKTERSAVLQLGSDQEPAMKIRERPERHRSQDTIVLCRHRCPAGTFHEISSQNTFTWSVSVAFAEI